MGDLSLMIQAVARQVAAPMRQQYQVSETIFRVFRHYGASATRPSGDTQGR